MPLSNIQTETEIYFETEIVSVQTKHLWNEDYYWLM